MADMTSTIPERVAQALLFSLESVGGLVNLLLLIAGLRSEAVRRSPFNVLTLYLIACDCLVQMMGTVFTAIWLRHSWTPDAQPYLCRTQAVISIFGSFCALSCWTFTALSRYFVIVKKQQLCKTHYLWMITCCTLIAVFNISLLLSNADIVGINSGRMLCLVRWSTRDGQHIYIIACNIVLFNLAVAVSLWSYYACFQFVATIKKSALHSNAVEWSQSPELVQLRRLFRLTLVLLISWSLLAGQVFYSVFSQQQVPPTVDQCAMLSIAVFYLYHTGTILQVNHPLRQAFIDLVSCRRHNSIQPGDRGSRRSTTSVVPTATTISSKEDNITMLALPRDASSPQRTTLDGSRKSTAGDKQLLSPSRRLTAGLDRQFNVSRMTLQRSANRETIDEHEPRARSSHARASSQPEYVHQYLEPHFLTVETAAESPRHQMRTHTSVAARRGSHRREATDFQPRACSMPDTPLQHVVSTTVGDNSLTTLTHGHSLITPRLSNTESVQAPTDEHVASLFIDEVSAADAMDDVTASIQPLTRLHTHSPSASSQQCTTEQHSMFHPVIG